MLFPNGVSLVQTRRVEQLCPYLVPVHSLLLHLLEFPLELALALQPLLGTAHEQHPPIDVLPVHVSHRLPAQGRQGKGSELGTKPTATALLCSHHSAPPGQVLPIQAPSASSQTSTKQVKFPLRRGGNITRDNLRERRASCLLGFFVLLEVDESEALGVATAVPHDFDTQRLSCRREGREGSRVQGLPTERELGATISCQPSEDTGHLQFIRHEDTSTAALTEPGEYFPQSVIIHVIPKVFDVDIGELYCPRPNLCLTLFAGFEVSNKPAGRKE